MELNELNKKLEITGKNQDESLQQFSDGMLKLALDGINEAVARERLKTAYWMRQAYILKSKLGKCRDCGNNVQKKDLDMWFYECGGSDCSECDDTENKENADFIKNYEPRK